MNVKIERYSGEVLDIGNDYYLVRKDVVEIWLERIEKLEKELQGKNVPKRRGTVSGKEGRNPVLSVDEKRMVKELREKGYSLREIAYVFRVSHETVRRALMETSESAEKRLEGSVSGFDALKGSNIFGTDKNASKGLTGAQNGIEDYLGDIRTGRPTDIMGVKKISDNPLE